MTHSNSAPNIILVPAQPEDIEIVLPLVRQFYHHFDYPFNESQKSEVLSHFLQDGLLGRIMLIKQDNKVIGYTLIAFSFCLEFNGPIAFIDELFIEPSGRQKGIGSKVLAEVEILCAGLGMKAVRLESEAHNKRATALYARSGYHDHMRHLMTKQLQDKET